MAVDKVDKYSEEISTGTEVIPQTEVKAKQKARLSTKVFSITMLGAMTIIIVDGLKNASNDPSWAVMCVLIGIPIYLVGMYELFHGK